MGCKALRLARSGLFYEFGWHATPYLMVSNLGALQYESTCSHDGTLAYVCIVENSRPHAYESPLSDGAGMHGGIEHSSPISTSPTMEAVSLK